MTSPRITLLLPCRNEKGTIGTAIELSLRLPGVDEVIVIEGNSADNTFQIATDTKNSLSKSLSSQVQVIVQSGVGKWNAVLDGMTISKNKHIGIWDADMTVSFFEQSQIHHKYLVHYEKHQACCLSTGNRMSSKEPGAMRFMNIIGNYFFSFLWSFLGNQRIPDLLCGSKVFNKDILSILPKKLINYDPYGDFSIFASAILSKQKIEFLNLTYRARTYGQTNIMRWSGGVKLLRVTLLFSVLYFKRISANRLGVERDVH